MKKAKKRRRTCFLSTLRYQCDGNETCLIENSFSQFTSSGKNQKVDHHKALNGTNFSNLFKFQLLPHFIEPSIIIVDNAVCHDCLPEKYCNISGMKSVDVLRS